MLRTRYWTDEFRPARRKTRDPKPAGDRKLSQRDAACIPTTMTWYPNTLEPAGVPQSASPAAPKSHAAGMLK